MTQLPKITPVDNGPLIVETPPNLTGSVEAELADKPKVVLCRCGASANKPFCDGAHAKVGFESAPDHSQIRNAPIDYTGEVNGTPVTVSYTPVLAPMPPAVRNVPRPCLTQAKSLGSNLRMERLKAFWMSSPPAHLVPCACRLEHSLSSTLQLAK